MIHFVLAGENIPFTVSLALMLAIGALEIVFSLFGPGLSHLLETAVPDLDHDIHPHVDGTGFEEVTPLSRLLSWLRIGEVPLLMLLVVFLTSFGLIGLGIQALASGILQFLLPAPLAAVGALFAAVPCVRIGGGLLKAIIPKDETQAVSEDSFVGKIAIITSGLAAQGKPAEARLQDQYKQAHYIFVEPDDAGDVFPAGTTVLIVKKENNVFRAIRNPNSALVD